MKRAALFLLLVVTPAWAAPPTLKLPASVSGEAGDFVTVPAETDGKVVKWVSLDAKLKLFPMDRLRDTMTAVVIGKTDGTYRLLAYTSNSDGPSDPAICVVTIGTPPDPKPPPPPPPPTDPLTQSLQDAYAAETQAGKATSLGALQSVYAGASSIVNDPTVKTYADLQASMHAAALKVLTDTALPGVRQVIAKELAAVFGTDPAKPIDRALAASEFQKIAAALKNVKTTRKEKHHD